MNTGKKLILGVFVTSLLSAAIMVVSIYELNAVNDRQNKILQIRPALDTLLQMRASIFDATQEAYAYVLFNDPKKKTDFYSVMNDFDDIAEQHYLTEENHNMNPIENQMFNKVMTLKNKFMDHADMMFATFEKGGKVDSESMNLFEDSKNSVALKIDELIDSEKNELRDLHDNLISNTASAVYTIVILGFVILFSAIIFGIVFSRRITRSIEEKIHLEKQLSESNAKVRNERFVAIGELSSRLAHDLRNPLNTIKICMDLLKRNLQNPDEKSDKLFFNMNRAVDRMSHQIDDVMDFVRKTPLRLDWHHPSEIIGAAINGINKPESVVIEFKNQDETLKIRCDASKIETVFSNLIINAVQAVGNKGRLLS